MISTHPIERKAMTRSAIHAAQIQVGTTLASGLVVTAVQPWGKFTLVSCATEPRYTSDGLLRGKAYSNHRPVTILTEGV